MELFLSDSELEDLWRGFKGQIEGDFVLLLEQLGFNISPPRALVQLASHVRYRRKLNIDAGSANWAVREKAVELLRPRT